MSSTRSAPPTDRGGLLAPAFRLVTVGSLAIVFLNAFENLAVATVMPVISRELSGAALYSVAFAGPLAIGVVGMVLAGGWSDRSGPSGALATSIAMFAVGLVVAGLAPTMVVLVVGRLLCGLAGGAISVTLYVVIARTYPDELHPRIFGSFAAAWIVPALVGPAIAGVVAQTVGWRWVFLGVVVLLVAAAALIAPVLRRLRGPAGEPVTTTGAAPVVWAVLLSVAVLGLGLAVELAAAWTIPVAVLAFVLALVAARPLLPARTLRAARGLPAVIALRLVLTAAYFGAEIYLPYLLTSEFGLSPSLAGLSLTGAAVAWGAASWVQGRVADRVNPRVSILVGVAGVLVATIAPLLTAALHLSPWVAIAGWTVGGIGMGMVLPRLSVLMLALSTPETQGFNSSALSIADAIGPAVALAVVGILFQGLGPLVGDAAAFAWTFVFDLAVAVLALAVALRIRDEPGTLGAH